MIGVRGAAPNLPRLTSAAASASIALALMPGCALVWDAPDGRRHVLGYHAAATPDPAAAAQVQALDVAGLALILGARRSALVLGLLRERQVSLQGDTAVNVRCLDCEPHHISLHPIDMGTPR